MTVYQHLLEVKERKGGGYLVLIDPDKTPAHSLPAIMENAIASGVDAFLVGGSLLLTPQFDQYVEQFKKYAQELPVIIFPGGVHQVSRHADAILFLSLLSGRNPDHLIGTQVLAAPIIHSLKLEAISTAYLLIESGEVTSAEFMSGTRPLPRKKPEIAVAHALAAEYFGFKFIYLEGGSGAQQAVPAEIIAAVDAHVNVPLIVGGGIRTPEDAAKKVEAGASFIVTGNVLETPDNRSLVQEFSQAIHQKGS
ncbi:Geranylgeranylglyceryl phosphate synthase [Caldithrix abyssi DSM 13497]|uniref:Phosphoglycerol geranylgeranyltransferase n=1 Tax=Caldithrix abyssi DSM 13497 TaxID=880073 RepID=H1XUR2_CALAY|nr:geranylgeranylglyceryl/heptaprenylglyceryl phosphate synthase [Caldithrix abyssi]APF17515.1 putative glycerol-1-phosphate prenyltransferase [Caldithrix abyssi DSM 13497]EHO41611.1 Geranylgeranylglyceryl phosphate synthase [Caldithrix abyssi DSM 13497]